MERQIQLPGPGARVAAGAKLHARIVHKYMRSCAQTLCDHVARWLQIIICMPTSCCDKRTTGALTCSREVDSDANPSFLKRSRDVKAFKAGLSKMNQEEL